MAPCFLSAFCIAFCIASRPAPPSSAGVRRMWLRSSTRCAALGRKSEGSASSAPPEGIGSAEVAAEAEAEPPVAADRLGLGSGCNPPAAPSAWLGGRGSGLGLGWS